MPASHDPGLYDLFVSYSTKDNVAPPGEREGWVQVFIQRIRALAAAFRYSPCKRTATDLLPSQ